MKTSNKGSVTIVVLLLIIAALALFAGYMYDQKKNLTSTKPGIVTPTPSSADPRSRDEQVIAAARKVITVLSARDYAQLESLVSRDGLSLSATPNLNLTKNDTAKKIDVAQKDISEIPRNTKVYLWGYTDGKGDPINLSVAGFINKYIYTADYQKAPNVAVNKIIGQGNSLNTIDKDVSGRTYVAFNFAGFEEKYSGMDWTTMYLVFDQENGEYKLRAIAKDNWTI